MLTLNETEFTGVELTVRSRKWTLFDIITSWFVGSVLGGLFAVYLARVLL